MLLVCTGQIEASTSPLGIPRAFDTFAFPGRREFDYQSLPEGGEFDPHALGVGNLNCTLDITRQIEKMAHCDLFLYPQQQRTCPNTVTKDTSLFPSSPKLIKGGSVYIFKGRKQH